MIQSAALLKDLKAQLKLLQADLRLRADDVSDRWGARLKEEYEEARRRERTGHSWVVWRDNEVDQAAVAWLVAMTFVRFCEDNDLLSGARINGEPVPVGWIAGPGDRTQRAEENLTAYFRMEPTHNRRDWIRQAFKILAAQPAGQALVDERHNPVWSADISAERAAALIDFWRETDNSGALVHDFTDRDLSTRFLGDLYQDLSEHAKKTYALLQTPEFVEELILDQTLTPALAEFGLDGFKLIDPTCGSGHFLLGAFARLVAQWESEAPALDAKERVRRAMGSIHGVDLNPFAIAIARFRLTVAGLLAEGERSLVGVPPLGFHLAIGDSLLGEFGGAPEGFTFEGDEAETYFYDGEDLKEYAGILQAGQYHVVVGNPPYIAPPDKATRDSYRASYRAISGKYVLSVPFMELFFRLAIRGGDGSGAGYVGKITSNSFMKREFGKRLIEWFFAGHDIGNPVDLTAVIDSSGAWIPGHNFNGTPTVILVGRRRRPVSSTVRAVYGTRGDATPLADPSSGPMWREITDHLDDPGYMGEYVAVDDAPRSTFSSHPWSLSGGIIDDLMKAIEGGSSGKVSNRVERIGFFGIVGYDDAFVVPADFPSRMKLGDAYRPIVSGDEVRDFVLSPAEGCFFPYDARHDLRGLDEFDGIERVLWPYRVDLQNRSTYDGTSYFDQGRPWWEWHQLPKDSAARTEAISFAEVATHNHFAIDRSGALFKRTAPVIKFPADFDDEELVGMYALLNSSVACFWLREVSYPKDKSKEPWETRHQFGSTKVGEFPLSPGLPSTRGARIESLADDLVRLGPARMVEDWTAGKDGSIRELAEQARREWESVLGRMVFEQEELDWEVYGLYGLIEPGDVPLAQAAEQVAPGGRAFEIALARRIESGGEPSAWFERHGTKPITNFESQWSDEYRALVEARLDLIVSDPRIALLEQPQNKRRWVTKSWAAQLDEALRAAILNRVERAELWRDEQGPIARSVAELSDLLRVDETLADLVSLLVDSPEFDLSVVLAPLLGTAAVPYLAALRYKEAGVEKFRAWQATWHLQRRQDAGERHQIAVPPKYNDKDFRKKEYWQARGKLDVPKERFIFYPDLRREGDNTVVLGWAGWDHREQALALGRELPMQESLGADDDLLVQMTAGLVELEPWVRQWHHEVDPTFGVSPAEVITGVIEQYLTRLETTRDAVTAWTPPAATRGRRPKNA